jgi:hypothetical protein
MLPPKILIRSDINETKLVVHRMTPDLLLDRPSLVKSLFGFLGWKSGINQRRVTSEHGCCIGYTFRF